MKKRKAPSLHAHAELQMQVYIRAHSGSMA